MIEIYERLGVKSDDFVVDGQLTLDHLQRDKGRLRTMTNDGIEARLFLERGKPLQVGELLRSQCGKTLRIEGAKEPVITARCDSWLLFSRACYHLGNRHVKIQIGERWLRIIPDHVLEQMLQWLGLNIGHEDAVFIPESGAYTHDHHHH